MLLQEVFNKHHNAQVVLSFSNNNEVLVTEDCFNVNSKFYRASRVRLGVDFVMSGVIQGETFLATTQTPELNHNEAIIYRTYRGPHKTDYVLYIFTGEYKLLEHFKRAVSYKRVMAQTDTQLTLNSITEPDHDKILHICPCIDDMQYWVSFKNQDLANGVYHTKLYQNPFPYSYQGYFAGVILGLNIAKRYSDKINQVCIHHTNDEWARGVYMFPLKKWTPKNNCTREYVKNIEQLKKQLQVLGVSICFME